MKKMRKVSGAGRTPLPLKASPSALVNSPYIGPRGQDHPAGACAQSLSHIYTNWRSRRTANVIKLCDKSAGKYVLSVSADGRNLLGARALFASHKTCFFMLKPSHEKNCARTHQRRYSPCASRAALGRALWTPNVSAEALEVARNPGKS